MATANMNLVLPTEGASTDVWDTEMNTALLLVDKHDHTSGKGVLVPSAGLGINANLSFAGWNASNVRALDFSTSAPSATSALNRCLFVSNVDDELYWRTLGGTPVKVTDGTSLNFSLVGGITGDYSSTDADLEYEDATKMFRHLQDEAPDHYANIACGNIDLYEPTSAIVERITMKSPTGLAASYNITWPAATPAAGKVYALVMNENGFIGTNDTGELEEIFHKEQELLLPPAAGVSPGQIAALATTGVAWNENGAGSIVHTPIPLKAGDFITSVFVALDRGATTATVYVWESKAGARAQLATVVVSAGAGVQIIELVCDFTMRTGYGYYVEWFGQNGSGADQYDISVFFTRPKP